MNQIFFQNKPYKSVAIVCKMVYDVMSQKSNRYGKQMQKITMLLLGLFLAGGTMAADKPLLQFKENGEFRIAQLTDTHINLSKNDAKHVFDLVRVVHETEHPDLFVLTGDIVTQHYPKAVYDKFSALFEEFNTPWTVVLGNHDDEYHTTRQRLGELLEKYPLCLNSTTPGITGISNYIVPVTWDGKPAALLYFLDSNAYSTLDKDKVDGYGWFDLSQITWYKSQSAAFTKANKGKPLPALAFFHIPLPEYNQVWDDSNIVKIGDKNEEVCCPKINTGMFAAMVECGDVMGTFVGHDHVNDYIGCLYGIALAYGRASGGINTYGDLTVGSRIIVLKKDKRRFDTWIRQTDGSKLDECHYPDSFTSKK